MKPNEILSEQLTRDLIMTCALAKTVIEKTKIPRAIGMTEEEIKSALRGAINYLKVVESITE